MKKVIIIVLSIILIDQFTKIYIKSKFEIGNCTPIFKWLNICFVENPGMAYGINIGVGYLEKIFLSIIRIFCIIYISLRLYKNIHHQYAYYFITPMAMILAGAIGNIIDNIFYGVIFDKGTTFDYIQHKWIGYSGISKINIRSGYSFFMGGCVVDMLSIPITDYKIPDIIPFFGGKFFSTAQPIFNISDISISIGTIIMLLSYKKSFLFFNI